jgi:hypothetical protein
VGVIKGGTIIEGARSVSYSTPLGSPAAASATAVHAAIALTSTTQTVTTGITSPDVPRNVTAKGNASGITGNVVITGTDAEDAALTETIALSGASEVVGNKAFKTVTSIALPAETHAGTDTVSIGAGSKLGLGARLGRNSVSSAYLAGVVEGTAPTVATSSTVMASNTVTLNSALNGTAVAVDYRT